MLLSFILIVNNCNVDVLYGMIFSNKHDLFWTRNFFLSLAVVIVVSTGANVINHSRICYHIFGINLHLKHTGVISPKVEVWHNGILIYTKEVK
jgi:hypothetical protein